ncbi:unnamed protein product [Leptidea sinapis]|nr:unnamed protein product [Leptidea sinapis]
MFKSSVFNLEEASKEQVQEFLNSFDTVLSDCDADVMNYFRKLGKRVFYVTNNSTKVRADFALKAQDLGFIAEPEEILSTAYLVAHYLKGIGFKKKVYLIGSNGIGDDQIP